MGRKTIDGKPVFGPERPPKKEENNSKNLKNFLVEDWLPLIQKEVEKAGGIKEFLEKFKNLAPQLRKIALENGNKVTKWAPKAFPELELKEEDLNKSYQNQLKIYDEIISSNKENYSDEDSPILGEDGNDQSE